MKKERSSDEMFLLSRSVLLLHYFFSSFKLFSSHLV